MTKLFVRSRDYYAAAALLAGFGALYGCARATIGCEIKPNGSWVRTVDLHGPATDKTGMLKGPPKIEDSFAIPAAPWTVTQKKTDDEIIVTIKRDMQLGELLKRDLVCRSTKDGKSTELMVNECSVKETSPGIYTYREVLHWVGPKPKDMFDTDAVKALKGSLPAALATDAHLAHLSEAIGKELLMTLMGPPDPLLTHLMSEIMMSPDLALHKLSSRVGDGIDHALVTEYGDKMTVAQRRKVVRDMVELAFKSTSNKAGGGSTPDPSKLMNKDESGSGTSLVFSVRLPGKLVSCNGDFDKATNEVYWGMYPEAAAIGQDIVLTASCQAK